MLNWHLLAAPPVLFPLHRGTIPHVHPHGSDLVVTLLAVAAAAVLAGVALRRAR
jgi:hypothetical protein